MTHTIVMTGATRGFGRVAVERILEGDAEAHLVLLARGAAGTELAAHLGQNGRAVTSIPTDLLSLGSVRAAADELIQRLDTGDLPPLRGFVGNAGLLYTNNVTESTDGFEATFAVNVLANHVLLRLLQDRFKAPSRIVLTVSDAHFGDFRHNAGMMPAPSWQDPASLARIRAFRSRTPSQREEPHTPPASSPRYTSSTSTHDVCHRASTLSPTTLGLCPVPA